MWLYPAVLRNDDELLDRLEEIIREGEIEKVIVGLPLTPSGKEGQRARLVREFVRRLKERFPDLDIELRDERYSAYEAKSRLADFLGRGKRCWIRCPHRSHLRSIFTLYEEVLFCISTLPIHAFLSGVRLPAGLRCSENR
ncbi:MAG: Holliday junction resolvase RuvX [Aquificota bacterium]|nr:Holliday junction resolvase RuvX [Aquificota bacterium]